MRIVVQQLNKQQTKNRAGGPMGIWGHLLSLQILAKLAEKSVASKDVVLTDRPPLPETFHWLYSDPYRSTRQSTSLDLKKCRELTDSRIYV